MGEWETIIADPKFQKEPLEVKMDVASNFFKQRIEADPKFQQETREAMDDVRANFFKTVDPNYSIESMKGAPVGEETTADRLGKIGLKLFGLKRSPAGAIASGIHGSAASIYSGVESMMKYGKLISDNLNSALGLDKTPQIEVGPGESPPISDIAIKFIEDRKKEAMDKALAAMPKGSATEKIIAGLASVPGGIAEFRMEVPYAMVKGYMNNGLKGMVEEGVGRSLWGLGMHYVGGVSPTRAVTAMAGAAGAESVARGESLQDTAANMTVMGILAATSGNKELSRANKIRVAQAEEAAKKGDFKSLADTLGEISKSQPDTIKEATIQAKNRVDELGKVTPDEIQKEVQRGLGVKEEDVADSYLALKRMGEEKKPAEGEKKAEPIVSPIEKIEEPPVIEEPVVSPVEEIAPIVKAEEAKAPPIEEAKAPEAITKEAVSTKIKELEESGKIEEAGVLREAFEIPKTPPKTTIEEYYHKGRPASFFVIDKRDGVIEQAVDYETAAASDFHHSFYVDSRFMEGLREGTHDVVWFDRGKLTSMEGEVPVNIKKEVLGQLRPIKTKPTLTDSEVDTIFSDYETRVDMQDSLQSKSLEDVTPKNVIASAMQNILSGYKFREIYPKGATGLSSEINYYRANLDKQPLNKDALRLANEIALADRDFQGNREEARKFVASIYKDMVEGRDYTQRFRYPEPKEVPLSEKALREEEVAKSLATWESIDKEHGVTDYLRSTVDQLIEKPIDISVIGSAAYPNEPNRAFDRKGIGTSDVDILLVFPTEKGREQAEKVYPPGTTVGGRKIDILPVTPEYAHGMIPYKDLSELVMGKGKPPAEAPLAEAPAKIDVPTVQRMDISKPETIVNPIVDLINKRNEAEKAGDVERVKTIQEQARIAKSVFWAKAAKDEAAGRVTREQTMKAWDEITKAEDATLTPKAKVKKDVVDVLEGNEREDIDKIMTPEEYKKEVIDKIPEPTAAELRIQEAELQKEIKLSNMKAIRLAAMRKAQKEGKEVSISPLKEEIERAPKEKDVKAQSDELTRLLMESGDIDGVIEERPGQYRRKGPKELKPEEDLHFGISEENYRLAKDYFTKGTKERLFGGGPDLEYVTHLTNIAGYHLARGMKKFEEFAQLMVKEVGEHVRPYLLKAWQAAQTQYKLQTEVYNSGYRIADPTVAAKWNNGAPIATLTDLQSVKNAVNDLPKGLYDLKGWLKTPERAFNYMQAANPGTDFKSLLRQWRHAQKEQTVASNLVSEQIVGFKKQVSRQELRDVALFSYGEQPGGKRIVEEFMKMKVPAWESLSPRAQQVYKFVRSQYEWVWKELNKMRVAVGEEPVGYIENYSPFAMARAIEHLEQNGMDIATAPKKAIENAFTETGFEFTHPKMTKFEYENRQMAMQKLSLDFTGTYKKYMDRALRHIYVSPVSVRTNAIISEWKPSTADKALIKMGMKQNALVPEKFKLADTAKNWADYLQAWSDYITGKPPLEKWPGGQPVMDLAFTLRNNIVAYTLMFSNRTTLVQFAALAQAYPSLGFRNLLSGVKDVLASGSKGWDTRNAISDTLLPRSKNYDTAISEFADAVQNAPGLIETYTPIEGVRNLATKARLSKVGAAHATVNAVYYKLGSLLMSATDNLSAHFVWQGAYNKAMKPLDKGGLGLKSDPAARYADDIVNQTQGSSLRGEISPLQRYQAGKTVSVFQTYNINQWGNIVQDLAGMDMPNISKQQGMKNIFRLMMGYAVANFIYEDILGMQSPFPTIFRRLLASMKAGDPAHVTAWKVAKEASEAGPFVSTVTKFGSHPLGAVAQLLSDTAAVVGEKKGPQPSGYELAGKWVGFPGGGQIAKSVRAAKSPESDLYDIVMGNYTGDRDTMIREILFSEGRPKPPSRPERPKPPKRP